MVEMVTSTSSLTAAERQELGNIKEKVMEIKESGINEIEEKPLTFRQRIRKFIEDKFPVKQQ